MLITEASSRPSCSTRGSSHTGSAKIDRPSTHCSSRYTPFPRNWLFVMVDASDFCRLKDGLHGTVGCQAGGSVDRK